MSANSPGAAEVIRVLIADDHAVVRRGLRAFLSLDPALLVVGEARDGAEAITQAVALQPDVVLMDLLMPSVDGLAATAAIRQTCPETEVLVLTSVLEDEKVVGAVRAGAMGYWLKDTDEDTLIRAIKGVAAGQIQLSPEAARLLVREIAAPAPATGLTEREIEVLRLLARGQTNKEIARVLGIGDKTVKTHVSHILSKLDVPGRTHAALYAVRIGLVAEGELGQRDGDGGSA